jgi:hypothetical protein
MCAWSAEKRMFLLSRVLSTQIDKELLIIMLFCILGIVVLIFDSLHTSNCRGRDVFLAKIGNLDRDHHNYMSLSNFFESVIERHSFRPRLSHAFVIFGEFPARFVDFRKLVLTRLELPRAATYSFAIFCDFFGSIQSLDGERYRSVLSQWKANGSPMEVLKRKIYVMCDWESVIW